MRMIKIDPRLRTITEVDVPGTMKAVTRVLGCSAVATVLLDQEILLICDSGKRMKPDIPGFTFYANNELQVYGIALISGVRGKTLGPLQEGLRSFELITEWLPPLSV